MSVYEKFHKKSFYSHISRTTSNLAFDCITDFNSNDKPLNSLSLVTTTKEDIAGEFTT